MDWVRQYGKGRVYTTMLGHTWKDELNPNLDDVPFEALLARGTEWAATGAVTLPADLGWKPLFNGKDLDGWEPRGNCIWTVMKEGTLLGQRTHQEVVSNSEAWLHTKRNDFGEFDLHAEFWLPPGGNSGISIRDPHIGYVYLLQAARMGVYRPGNWNSMEIESRKERIRVRVNGELVAESAGEAARAKTGPIGLQLHDRFSFVMFRNLRVRELP